MDIRFKTIYWGICTFFFICLTFGAGSLLAQTSSSQKNLRIAITDIPPFQNVNPDGKHDGIMIEFLDAIAEKENWNIEWVTGEWSDQLKQAQAGEIDLLTFVAYSEERTSFLDFNDETFLTGWGQIYVQEKNDFETIFDFEQQKIATIKDDYHAVRLEKQCESFDVDCKFVYTKDYESAFTLLEKGEVKGVACGNLIGLNYEPQYNIKQSPIIFNATKTIFASPKGMNADVLNTLDGYIKLWRNDTSSPYYKLKSMWLNPVDTNHGIPKWLLYGLLGFFLFSLIASGISLLLRRKVHEKIQELNNQHIQFEQFIKLIPHLVYATDENGKIIVSNPTAREHLGLKGNELSIFDKKDIIDKHPQTSELFSGEELLLSKDAKPIEKEISTVDSKFRETILNVSKIPFVECVNNTLSVMTVGTDITNIKEYERQIEHLAHHDTLTNLPNRLLISDRINMSLIQAKLNDHTGAVLFIDLDFFKNINDSYGHFTGDMILIEASKRISKEIGSGDTAARLGGDEFVVHLSRLSDDPKIAEKTAMDTADNILRALAKPITIDDTNISLTASIGVVIYPRDADDIHEVMQRTDIAMYKAKVAGRDNSYLFTHDMEASISHRNTLEKELRKAIDQQEFIVHYQPQISSSSGKLLAVEALIRWQHPNRGLISPIDFIPIAEENSLIIPIGEIVLEQAIKQIKSWLDKFDYSPIISVNISSVQLSSSNICSKIERLLKQYDVSGKYLELEITETVILNDLISTIEKLKVLRGLGIGISIDDFGVGFSSLNYLRQLPLSKLKIDRSFINEVPHQVDSKVIVQAVISISQKLGLTVVAEGVETQEQVDFLTSEHCDTFQGFFFSKPRPFEEIEQQYLNKKLQNNSVA